MQLQDIIRLTRLDYNTGCYIWLGHPSTLEWVVEEFRQLAKIVPAAYCKYNVRCLNKEHYTLEG
jgi:hypothetical protein